MTVLAAIYALFVQMSGSALQDNAWTDKFLDFTFQNVVGIEKFLENSAYNLLIVGLIFMALAAIPFVWSIMTRSGRRTFKMLIASLFFMISAVLIALALLAFIFWLVGLLHVLVVGYLATNFTVAGPLNPGFWLVVLLVIMFSWS